MIRIGALAAAVALCAGGKPARAQSNSCLDRDGDGYFAGPGCAVAPFDCNDQNPAVHPGALEVCNGWDDNCDGRIDEGCASACPNFQLARTVLIHAPATQPAIAAADRSWAVILDESLDGVGMASTRLDLLGQKLLPETAFGTAPADVQLVWTGRDMTASWSWRATPGVTGQSLELLGAWGKAGGQPTLMSTDQSSSGSLVWNGFEYGVLWDDVQPNFTDGTLFGLADVAADSLQQNTYLSNDPRNGSMAWNGAGYAWVYVHSEATGHVELSIQLLTPSGQPNGPATPLTDHTGSTPGSGASRPVIVGMGDGQGYGVLWMDDRTGRREVWFAALNHDGSPAGPPEGAQVSFATTNVPANPDLAWSGAEFLAAWVNLDAGGRNGGGQVMGSRLSTTGAVLATAPVTTGPDDDTPRLAWNGSSYGLVFERILGPYGTPNVMFGEIGCNCTTDADHDGILPCGGGDCDDTDASVGPGKPEICNDGKDNNCDGLVDCNDPTCAENGGPPFEIGNVRFSSGKTTLSWNADSKSTGYDVARGVIGDLRDLTTFRWADCLVTKTTQTTASDIADPPPGAGFYYLVRGRAKTCLLGTWGSPNADATLHGCP